jgi:hypothetical protein
VKPPGCVRNDLPENERVVSAAGRLSDGSVYSIKYRRYTIVRTYFRSSGRPGGPKTNLRISCMPPYAVDKKVKMSVNHKHGYTVLSVVSR